MKKVLSLVTVLLITVRRTWKSSQLSKVVQLQERTQTFWFPFLLLSVLQFL